MTATEPAAGGGPRPGRDLAILLAFHAAFFLPAYLTDDTFFLRDYSIVQSSVKAIALADLQQGELPLWLPSLSGGQPLMGSPNYFLLHPGNAFLLLLGVVRGLKAFLLSQYLLASIGGWLLGRRSGLPPAAALLLGIGFAYGGFLAAMGNLLNALAAAALLPWLLLAAARAAAGERGGLLGLACTGAMQIFGGEPVPAILSFTLAVAGTAAVRGLAAASRVLLGLVLAGAVAGPQVVPAAIFLGQSDRAAGLSQGEALKWSLPPIRLLELALPELLGSADYVAPPGYLGGPFEDGNYPYVVSVFAGPVLLLLAAAGAAAHRGARQLLLAASVAALLACGKHVPLVPLLLHLPGAAIFRYPSKLHLVVSFALAAAAALGLREVRARVPLARATGAAGLVAALALAALLPRVGAAVVGASLDPESPAGAAALARHAVGGYAMVGILLLASALLLLAERPLRSELLAPLLAGLHAATLLCWMPQLLPLVPRSFYDATPPPVAAILAAGGGDGRHRVYVEPSAAPLATARHPELAPAARFPASAAEVAFGLRMLGFEYVGRIHGLEYAFDAGWEGGALRSIRRAADEVRALPWEARRARLATANVRFVLGFDLHPELELRATIPGLERRPLYVQEIPHAAPRVAPPARLVAATPTRMRIDPGGAREVRVQVNGYPLWRADGARIASASDAPEIVLVPDGAGPVTLFLDPWDLRLGALLGLAGIAAAIGLDRRDAARRS